MVPGQSLYLLKGRACFSTATHEAASVFTVAQGQIPCPGSQAACFARLPLQFILCRSLRLRQLYHHRSMDALPRTEPWGMRKDFQLSIPFSSLQNLPLFVFSLSLNYVNVLSVRLSQHGSQRQTPAPSL